MDAPQEVRQSRWARLLFELGPSLAADVDAEAEAFRNSGSSIDVHLRTAIVILSAIPALLLAKYGGDAKNPLWLSTVLHTLSLDSAAASIETELLRAPVGSLWPHVYWAVVRLLSFGLLPALVARFVLRERWTAMGWGLGQARHHAWVYVSLVLLALPLVVFASTLKDFQMRYPFYRPTATNGWTELLVWELLYASHFVVIEFFFRGFLLQGLRKTLGYAALFVQVLPYVMLHLNKPFLEAFGAGFTALILGALALRGRSLWPGAALHVVVATTLDVLCWVRRGVAP